MNKLFELFSFINIINIFGLIIYYFENLRNFFKTIFKLLYCEELLIIIGNLYTENILYFKTFLYLYFIIVLIKLINIEINYNIDKKIQKDMALKSVGIDKNLYDYINSDEKKCFVITGNWGVGKTYTIDNFLNKYFKYEKRDIYRISCFGMENRKDILDELKNVFEKQDNSLKKHILNLCKKIPIIGEFIEEIFKSDYEFKDLKEKSVFIFDDFERINIPQYPNHVSPLYRCKKSGNNRNMNEAFRDIYKEFNNVSNGFESIENSLNMIRKERNLERYNIITGLINELIERYNMKVIVLCNNNRIDKNFFNDMFEYKIESIIYNLKNKTEITKELVNQTLKRKIYLKEELKNRLGDFFEENSELIDNIWNNYYIDNIRVLSMAVCAFIDILEKNIIDKKYDKCIFYTILICNMANYSGREENIKNISLGESIKVFYEKHKEMYYNKEKFDCESLFYLISKEASLRDLRWCGTNIGFSYLSGNHNYNGLKRELEEYEKYDCSIEEMLCSENEEFIFEKDNIYKFDDLMYCLKLNVNNENLIESILKIIDEKRVDYASHTSFNYESFYMNDRHVGDDTTLRTIISILALYNIDEELIYRIFKRMEIDPKKDEALIVADHWKPENLKKVEGTFLKVIEELKTLST